MHGAAEEQQQGGEVAGAWRPGALAVGALVLVVALVAGAVGYALGGRDGAPSAVDVGFLQDMVDHHDQAVEMGKRLDRRTAAPLVAHVADEVITTQRYEVGVMVTLLEGWGEERGADDRQAMAWMGHGHPVGAMPGMATGEDLRRLSALDGPEADALFLRLMAAHHRGGVEMASNAARRASDRRVRELAARMAEVQAVEIREMDAIRQRLALPA